MGLVTDVRLRQPRRDDLVGDRIVVAGIGAGFEGTIGIRVLGPRGSVLGQDSAQSSGGGLGVGDFSARVRLTDPPRSGTRVTVQVFGDNPCVDWSLPRVHQRSAQGIDGSVAAGSAGHRGVRPTPHVRLHRGNA